MISTPNLGRVFFRLWYGLGSNLFHQSLADIVQQHAIDNTASAVASSYNTVPLPSMCLLLRGVGMSIMEPAPVVILSVGLRSSNASRHTTDDATREIRNGPGAVQKDGSTRNQSRADGARVGD
ncbi:Hypothetical protein GbCGDNIH3_8109 [Granulibacter bethesdensis]|uniref:Uncharacterized protein n=1 Tax=Granulibacter bethesdensis TaxID=364410 RepID=A0AAN1E6D1_9PROT|nr:Hypothetical protein GbCGDNIH3_8109 [Granulibacter bethesdensis]